MAKARASRMPGWLLAIVADDHTDDSRGM
jgi:hypothetical protein